MQYWLFKSEPSTWSWDQQVAKGDIGEEWDGVRNYQARNFMRQMNIGDLGFFYHSQKDKEIVGIVEVCANAHPDSTTDDARWECVDIRAVKADEHSCDPRTDKNRSTFDRNGIGQKLSVIRATRHRRGVGDYLRTW